MGTVTCNDSVHTAGLLVTVQGRQGSVQLVVGGGDRCGDYIEIRKLKR